MDNIVYTYAIPLIIGIFFGEIRYCHTLFVSNTKLIMRQSDQIQFLLTRIMELETKIKKLQLDIDIPNEDFLDAVAEDVLDTVAEDVLDAIVEDVEDVEDIVAEEKDDKEFELVETTSTFKINKNKGWLQYIF